ncbi:MAG: hypothetical protein MJE68_13785, partial [Proteobacteria bacterium]|nr:hypothetical protein [Pseudomonadota bacterium]
RPCRPNRTGGVDKFEGHRTQPGRGIWWGRLRPNRQVPGRILCHPPGAVRIRRRPVRPQLLGSA